MIGKESLATMTNGRDLDPNPRIEVPLLLMLKADVAALSKILLGHGTIGDFQ